MWILGLKGLMGIEGLQFFLLVIHAGRSFCSVFLLYPGVKGGAVVRELASHLCGAASNPGIDAIIMWVEFVVGSLLCFKRFFSWYSGFPLSLKTNSSEFQLDLECTDTFQRVLMNS